MYLCEQMIRMLLQIPQEEHILSLNEVTSYYTPVQEKHLSLLLPPQKNDSL